MNEFHRGISPPSFTSTTLAGFADRIVIVLFIYPSLYDRTVQLSWAALLKIEHLYTSYCFPSSNRKETFHLMSTNCSKENHAYRKSQISMSTSGRRVQDMRCALKTSDWVFEKGGGCWSVRSTSESRCATKVSRVDGGTRLGQMSAVTGWHLYCDMQQNDAPISLEQGNHRKVPAWGPHICDVQQKISMAPTARCTISTVS